MHAAMRQTKPDQMASRQDLMDWAEHIARRALIAVLQTHIADCDRQIQILSDATGGWQSSSVQIVLHNPESSESTLVYPEKPKRSPIAQSHDSQTSTLSQYL